MHWQKLNFNMYVVSSFLKALIKCMWFSIHNCIYPSNECQQVVDVEQCISIAEICQCGVNRVRLLSRFNILTRFAEKSRAHFSIQPLLWLSTSFELTIWSNPYLDYPLLQNPLFDPILALVTDCYRNHYSIQSLLWLTIFTEPTIRSNPYFGYPLLQNPQFDPVLTFVTSVFWTHYSIKSLLWLPTSTEPTIRSNYYFAQLL